MEDQITTSLAEAKILVIQGQKGDTGAVGPQGPKGDTGAAGPQGPAGDDYVLTAEDKADIAMLVVPLIPSAESEAF